MERAGRFIEARFENWRRGGKNLEGKNLEGENLEGDSRLGARPRTGVAGDANRRP